MLNELSEIIKIYATKPHKELNSFLLDKSKDSLIALFNNLLTLYINDKNSSTIREHITVSLAGYTPIETKIGYNGFKQLTFISGELINCEAKPRNINMSDKKPRKHNGGGNFNDYTHKRFRKDFKANLNILTSGFIDGELIFILEFPFRCKKFTDKLLRQLKRRLPNGDKSGQYLRGASFTFKDYKGCRELKVIYLEKLKMLKYKNNFSKEFINFLTSKFKNYAANQ